jgi:hypothetical protein
MGTSKVLSDTNPNGPNRRRLEAGGPLGFIMAVYETLREYDRPYYYSSAIPDWLEAKASGARSQPQDFSKAYENFQDRDQKRRDLTEVPHCIIHQWRKYPAKTRFAGTSDSPRGTRRQKTPRDKINHERPLPNPPEERPDEANEPEMYRKAFGRDSEDRPPLWDSKEQVPDLIRDEVDPDSTMYVTPWDYDVFVDFILVAGNQYLIQQMERDFMTVLHTFHQRWATGSSNLSGWFYQSVSGATSDFDQDIPDRYPVRTITWRLKQTENYAFPVRDVNDVRLDLYGDQARPIRIE